MIQWIVSKCWHFCFVVPTVRFILSLALTLYSPDKIGVDHEHQLSKDCGDLMRKLVIPQMVLVKQVSTHLFSTFALDFPPNEAGVVEKVSFSDIDRMSARLREFDVKYVQNLLSIYPADSFTATLNCHLGTNAGTALATHSSPQLFLRALMI